MINLWVSLGSAGEILKATKKIHNINVFKTQKENLTKLPILVNGDNFLVSHGVACEMLRAKNVNFIILHFS